jgi:nucleoside-diphosphate-sugar epimerase
MGENMCVCWSHQFGFQVNMLRLSHTYGPGIALNDGRVFADFVQNVLHNENIVLKSDGKAKRSFVYITDMMRAFFLVLFNGENQQAYNVASDTETEIIELAMMLCNLYPEKKLMVTFAKNNPSASYIRSDSTSAALCADKLKLLGWRQQVSIKTGFRRMIESYYVLRK